MNVNESRLVNGIVNHEANINNMIAYIKDNYNINGVYNEDDCTIKLKCNNPDDALMLAAAKEYIEDSIGNDFVTVIF